MRWGEGRPSFAAAALSLGVGAFLAVQLVLLPPDPDRVHRVSGTIVERHPELHDSVRFRVEFEGSTYLGSDSAPRGATVGQIVPVYVDTAHPEHPTLREPGRTVRANREAFFAIWGLVACFLFLRAWHAARPASSTRSVDR